MKQRISAPSPPVVTAALTGFVVGILVALAATGVVARRSHSAVTTATLPPFNGVADPKMYQDVRRIVTRQLGLGYPNEKRVRLVSLSLLPSTEIPRSPGNLTEHYRSVYVVFRLNDHPLGRVWRLRAAKADVFGVMRSLYTSGLPIYDVEMDGTYPLKKHGQVKERPALAAYMDQATAATIPWKRWSRANEAQLWSRLTYKLVDRQFA